MPKTKKEWMNALKRIAIVILGSFILGIGTGLFLVPYNIVAGGLSGISLIINTVVPNMPFSVEVMITILTWIFFFLGWILLGNSFAIKTIISAIVYPFSLMLGTLLVAKAGLKLEPMDDMTNCLIAAVFSGVFVGAGVGLTFTVGGSTGGVDVITLVIQKYTGIKASIPTFIIDSSIIITGFFVNGNNFSVILLGIISAFVSSIMVDKIFDSERNVVVTIVSKEYESINKFIIEKLERGSTFVQGVGGYSEKDVMLIQVVLNYREYYILADIIAKVDPNAFVYTTKVSSVRGEGFKAHKTISRAKLRKKQEDEAK